MKGIFYVVGTPIGNLQDITLRALQTLKEINVIFCEDTRRTLKLLNYFEIKKPLKSCPYFRERSHVEEILKHLERGEKIAYVVDAGMPGISDPGSILVHEIRKKGFKVEIIGGVNALTYFLSGLGVELEKFQFIGFLPDRSKRRADLFQKNISEPLVFFESTHRIQRTLELLKERCPQRKIILGKELSKISENFFEGTAEQLLLQILSFKGEWVGCLFPEEEK